MRDIDLTHWSSSLFEVEFPYLHVVFFSLIPLKNSCLDYSNRFVLAFTISEIWEEDQKFCFNGGHRGRDRMVVGFTTTCAISAHHHLSCEDEPRSWRGVLDTTLCDKVCQLFATGRLFSLSTPVSSTNKTDCHLAKWTKTWYEASMEGPL